MTSLEQKDLREQILANVREEIREEVAYAIDLATTTADAEPSAAMNTFEDGKPLPYFCPACQAVPRAGYCKLAGCPTAPEESAR